MAFKFRKGPGGPSETPEALFLDTRTRKVPGLLSHQADMLRNYVKDGKDVPDVALQLPTGSGKTLVGLLIAEWRRRKMNELCVYLCPTIQLVYQVADQARSKYGLKVNTFVGKKVDYSAEAKGEYLGGEAIAITSYSSLFNIKPFFENPSTIVLDDAHAAENYISSMWSLKIERHKQEHAAMFSAIVNVLSPVLTKIEYQRLTEPEQHYTDRSWVEKIPTPKLVRLLPELASVLEAHVAELELVFPWILIRDHLDACHCYVSQQEVLIRPLLPPTYSHSSFSGAKHRVYMSATLGEGGELERISGRRSIKRIGAPEGWDKQGVGRRLFFFPGRTLNEAESVRLATEMISVAGRALVLVPDDKTANVVRGEIKGELGIPTFDAKAIEVSKGPFLAEKRAVAVVANRYDGIDFLDDQCRLIVILGLPRATNLQERFIVARMGAVSLLNDRILTRMVQAFGRCTRSPNDYAAIVIVGEELFSYLMQKNRRSFLHPELQAELQFGIEQAVGTSTATHLDNFRLFLKQNNEWQDADQYIVELRESQRQNALPGTKELGGAAPIEVAYQEALWQQDYEGALDASRAVLAQIQHNDLRGYRALWGYLAGSAAWLAARGKSNRFEQIAKKYFREAKATVPTVTWLASLASEEAAIPEAERLEATSMCLVERLELVLEKLGTAHDRRYDEEEKFILSGIGKEESEAFEAAHERLGRLLGFDAGRKKSQGSPDPWWIVNDELCFVFEDYSEAKAGQELDVKKARQVSTHPNWIRENVGLKENAKIVPILVSPIAKVSTDALPHLRSVILWDVEHFRQWAIRALGMIRNIRRSFTESGDLAWRADTAEKLHECQVAPREFLEMLEAMTKAKKYPR